MEAPYFDPPVNVRLDEGVYDKLSFIESVDDRWTLQQKPHL